MGGGGGKAGASSSGPTEEQKATQKYFLENVSKPVGDTLVPQVTEALKTGGVNAQIPLVQQATEQSRSATSQSLANARNIGSRTNLSGTPYAAMIESLIGQQGALATETIPTELAGQFAQLAPNLLTQGGNISVSGPGVSKSRTPKDNSWMGEAIGGAAQGAGAAYAACWIAASLYGWYTPRFWLAREWIFELSGDGSFALLRRRLYLRYGERIASLLNAHPSLKLLARPFFAYFCWRAKRCQ